MKVHYFKVWAKCGHVGRNKYILKLFYIKANSKKEAALRIRMAPRVKHHHKDAIREVSEVTFRDYKIGCLSMANDYYFKVKNRQMQNFHNAVSLAEVKSETSSLHYPKRKYRRYLLERLINKEWQRKLNGGYYE